jgi:kumamolisin
VGGILRLINEALGSAGMPALGFANPTFYQLAGTAAFRDITVGTNGAFTASKGYDWVTGMTVHYPAIEKLAR